MRRYQSSSGRVDESADDQREIRRQTSAGSTSIIMSDLDEVSPDGARRVDEIDAHYPEDCDCPAVIDDDRVDARPRDAG